MGHYLERDIRNEDSSLVHTCNCISRVSSGSDASGMSILAASDAVSHPTTTISDFREGGNKVDERPLGYFRRP